ncbi:Nucleoredoxin [Babesia bigemina]|uniref:Nucleoredoxin n=1 Tax=Babesia bigemina TaxID=5866 RepID=A0A061D4T4_BABBI|nr:Nucleoredoxin [Babesia bigemina]CDR95057.1 Nucleoredoxin [Babesia bigemina]|eukprot:XP_012767243.1 Nucleoredoxin [Babesia bigemina]
MGAPQRALLAAAVAAVYAFTAAFPVAEARLERRPTGGKHLPVPLRSDAPRLHSAFFARDPLKLPQNVTPPSGADAHLPERAIFGPLSNDVVKKAAVVTGTVALTTALGYAYVRRVLWHHLYGKYIREDAPGIADALGHVLYTKDDPGRVALRRRSLFDVLAALLLAPLERCPWIRGLLKTNIRRIPIGEAIEEGSVTALYFHSNNVHRMLQDKGYRDFTKNLKQIQETMKESGRKFQVVYVNVDRKQVDGVDHFRDMPWYALPFDDKERVAHLCQLYDITGIPSVVLLNSDGSVINDRALYLMANKPNNFPWKVESPLDLIPDTLVNGNNQAVPKASLEGKIVALYFGAGWTRSSKEFSEKLQEFHRAVGEKTDGKFEVVYVSNDKNQADFEKELFDHNGNWLAVPFEDADSRLILQQYLKVPMVPAVVLLDPSGNVITADGRFYVEADRAANALPYASYLNRHGQQLVEDVAVNVDAFAHQPVVIVFADDVDPATQQVVESQLAEAAMQHANHRKGRQMKFFISKTADKRSGAVRSICGVDKNAKPQAVVLDLLAQKVYYDPKLTNVDQNSLLALVDDFYNNRLRKRAVTIR